MAVKKSGILKGNFGKFSQNPRKLCFPKKMKSISKFTVKSRHYFLKNQIKI